MILFGKYSGSEVKIEGTEYLIMREDDVLGIVEVTLSRMSVFGITTIQIGIQGGNK